MKRASKDFDVIVGLNSSINGDVISEGSVRIDGKLSGSIKSKGDVIISDNAVVNADIDASYCEISGQVTGKVHSETQLKIFKSGSLKGDITVSSFTIDEGGIFQGNCDITPDKKEVKAIPEIKQHDNKKQDEKNNQNKNHKNEKNAHHNQNTKKTVS